MLHLLLAQSSQSLGPSIVQALSNNGFWVFVGICVLAGTAKNIVSSILRHRERIAMIESGMPPTHDAADPHATVDYPGKRVG